MRSPAPGAIHNLLRTDPSGHDHTREDEFETPVLLAMIVFFPFTANNEPTAVRSNLSGTEEDTTWWRVRGCEGARCEVRGWACSEGIACLYLRRIK